MCFDEFGDLRFCAPLRFGEFRETSIRALLCRCEIAYGNGQLIEPFIRVLLRCCEVADGDDQFVNCFRQLVEPLR